MVTENGNKDIFIVIGDKINYDRTIKNNVNIEELHNAQVIKDEDYNELKKIYPDGKMKCWGFQDNNSKNVWGQMDYGDLCLMYYKSKIVMSGIIKYKFHNSDVADYIWESGDKPFEYIFCFEDVHILDIQSSKVLVEEFDYADDFIRGGSRLARNRLQNVINKHDSVESFREHIEEGNNGKQSHNSKFNGGNMSQKNGLSIESIIDRIKNYIKYKGYTYPEHMIENFYLSLKTKPFVLLAGISGTGKTKLVELFAEAIGCTEENGQFKLISVKPDWNDSSDLLGYNNIRGDFQPGPLLKTIKHAVDYPEKPHIVCMDEMNLARVEYYFSDFLSKMETRRFIGDKIKTDRLLTKEDFDKKDEESIKRYADIFIPDNLYIAGTVNMDETTHPFSKKVLDRANTIEFNEIELMAYQENINSNLDAEGIFPENDFLRPQFLSLKDTLPEYKSLVDEITTKLVEMNKILKDINLPAGYRIRDEINFYVIESVNKDILNKNTAFDKQITQKILPRIQGSSRMIKTVLVKLFKFTSDKDFTKENGELGGKMLNYYQDNKENIKYPYSTEKIVYMLKRYEEDGFTAYWL